MSNQLHTRERSSTAARKQDLLEAITAYMDANLTRRLTLREVSEHFQVSISTVTQLFQKRADHTFHQYLTQRRMAAAKDLIREGTPLEEVGRRVGYTDHSSFYRAFRQSFGVSPREYRRGDEKK